VTQQTDKNAPPERLLDVTEAASFLGVRPATIYAWSHRRKIPVVKLGRNLLRFRLSDLHRYVRQHMRPALDRAKWPPYD
jgi:excisionase family DNA binding protein